MAFTCPRCGRTSHHPEDENQGYCGACQAWTAAPGTGDAVLVGGPAHGMVVPLPPHDVGVPEAIHVEQEGLLTPMSYFDVAYVTPSGRRVYAAQGVTVDRCAVRLPLPTAEEIDSERVRGGVYVELFSRALAMFMGNTIATGYHPVEAPQAQLIDHPTTPILVVHGAMFRDMMPPARRVEATLAKVVPRGR